MLTSYRQLKQRQIDTTAAFPGSVVYREGEFDDTSADMELLYARLLIKLEHLQNLFVVERLLSRRGHQDEGELLTTSFELVSRTLLFWTNKDRFTLARADFAWLVRTLVTPSRCVKHLADSLCRSWPMLRPAVEFFAWSF
jgi:hypothetical protein